MIVVPAYILTILAICVQYDVVGKLRFGRHLHVRILCGHETKIHVEQDVSVVFWTFRNCFRDFVFVRFYRKFVVSKVFVVTMYRTLVDHVGADDFVYRCERAVTANVIIGIIDAFDAFLLVGSDHAQTRVVHTRVPVFPDAVAT